MRLLADENIHRVGVSRLRKAGFNVECVGESNPGISDEEILARADISEVIFLTNDRDFGDLIFKQHRPCPRAVVYTRMPHRAGELTATRLIALLEAGVPAGQMITLTKNGKRTRPFPDGA